MNAELNARIELQDRDVELLLGLYESRLMTLAHAAALHFGEKREAAKKRVQRLKIAGLVGERRRRAYEPSILFLTPQGFQLLRDRGTLSSFPTFTAPAFERRAQVKDSTLRHELDVMDVKAALVTAVHQANHFDVAEFCTWPLLNEFRADRPDGATVTVKPDGFIRIHEHGVGGSLFEHTFFFEVDRSTETQETVALKAACYRDYYRRGGFAERNGRPRTEFESFPFRVLMVFRNAERRNNAAERMLLLTPPVLSQVWLTTFNEVTTQPLAEIWVRPLDYRAAVHDTRFHEHSPQPRRTYRRQAEREAFVESRITKHQLLDLAPSTSGSFPGA